MYFLIREVHKGPVLIAAVAQLLAARRRKVAGSIPGGVIGIFE
jgi:hypothetical protein